MNDELSGLLIKYNGYLTTKIFLENNISKFKIKQYLNNKLIEKVSHGIYIDSSIILDEYYLLQLKYNNIVFSYNTAFFIHNIANRIPEVPDVTTIKGLRINEELIIHYCVKDKYEIGIEIQKTPFGNEVCVYNLERCICDILKYENSMELEQRNKVIGNYFKCNKRNIDRLYEYSKLFNVYDKVNLLVEMMEC